MQIAPGLHRIEAPLGERYIAMYLVEGNDCCALVDTGLQDSITETLVPYLAGIDRPAESIRWVVNTHADFDHVGGNGAMRTLCPDTRIVCGAADRRQIEDIEVMIDERYGEFRRHGFDESDDTKSFIRSVAGTVPVDDTVGEGVRLELGGRYLEVLGSPGHSDGHLSLIDSESGAALIGDAVLWDSVLTATGEPAFPPTYRSVGSYRDTIRRLRSLDVPLLLTAHYAVARDDAVSEFLDGSLDYTDLVEHTLLDILASAPAAVGLLDIVRRAAPTLGPWPAGPADYLVYPVLGHLELLEAEGRIERDETGERPAWRLHR